MNTTVLIAEENFLTARLLSATLTGAGLRCLHARNGEEAVGLALEHRPALLLLNLNFARPNGVELIRSLRTMGVSTPILGMTLSGQADLRSAAGALGVRSFLESPFDPAEVATRIDYVMGG